MVQQVRLGYLIPSRGPENYMGIESVKRVRPRIANVIVRAVELNFIPSGLQG